MDMEPMDLIRDKFSQDCSIETVLHLVMAHFDLSEEEALAEINAYFKLWKDTANKFDLPATAQKLRR